MIGTRTVEPLEEPAAESLRNSSTDMPAEGSSSAVIYGQGEQVKCKESRDKNTDCLVF